MSRETFNIFSGETEPVPPGAPGERGRAARVGSKIGGERLGMSVYDLPAGEAIGPYHVELTDEEWLIVVHGHVIARTPDGERTLAPGDVLCFPVGPEGAHVIRSADDEAARVAIISTKNEFSIVEYPRTERSSSGRAAPTTCSTCRPTDSLGHGRQSPTPQCGRTRRLLPARPAARVG